MANIKALAEELVNLTVKDVNELSSILKNDYGIEPAVAAAPVAVQAVSNEAAPAAAEKNSFNVILKNAGTAKLQVIKIVKEITGKGLKEAKDMVDAGNQTVKDVNELSSILKNDYGIEPAVAAAPVAVQAVNNEATPAAAEKSSFNVILKNAGTAKIQVIKIVKEITGKGLKEAKDIVEAKNQTVKENVSKAEANDIKAQLEAAGAEVELK